MANQQVIVIGLGQFGMSLARALSSNGVDVIATDRKPERVQAASTFVTEALELDAMDEGQLRTLRPDQRDISVCAIGDDNKEASIICTALLRQLGARRLIARATDDTHERILRLVGAHEVVNPERNFGERFAARLSFRNIVDILPLGDDLLITEMSAPEPLVGRRLSDLQLPRRYGVNVVAIRRVEGGQGRLMLPQAELVIQSTDVLVLVGPPGAAHRLAGRA